MLFWCYVCPPLAVLLMGRPFSAILNCFFTAWFWVPGVKHALLLYVDYKSTSHVTSVTDAIRGKPERGQRARPALPEPEAPRLIDNPCVGAHGTQFKRRR